MARDAGLPLDRRRFITGAAVAGAATTLTPSATAPTGGLAHAQARKAAPPHPVCDAG